MRMIQSPRNHSKREVCKLTPKERKLVMAVKKGKEENEAEAENEGRHWR